MFGSEILEVAMGVVFVFLLVSIICSTIREGLEAWFKTRAAYLEYGIRELLHDKEAKGLAKSFFEHPLVYGLYRGGYETGSTSKNPGLLAKGKNLPSYIPARTFAQVLMDIAARGPETNIVNSDPNGPAFSLANMRMNILNIQNPPVQRALLTAFDSAQGDLNQARLNIEDWYNGSMDRLSGWYKRSTAWILFWIGLFVAISMNINTITIINYLYKDDIARAALVSRAETAAKDPSFPNKGYEDVKKELNALALPMGWNNKTTNLPNKKEDTNWWDDILLWDDIFVPLLGWLFTALAATMGAPFWFDLLNKFMVIRSTVKPHEKSPEEPSKDRQLPAKGNTDDQVVNLQNAEAPIFRTLPSNTGQQQMISVPTPQDSDSDIDGCACGIDSHRSEDITLDEELPLAQGGVAQ